LDLYCGFFIAWLSIASSLLCGSLLCGSLLWVLYCVALYCGFSIAVSSLVWLSLWFWLITVSVLHWFQGFHWLSLHWFGFHCGSFQSFIGLWLLLVHCFHWVVTFFGLLLSLCVLIFAFIYCPCFSEWYHSPGEVSLRACFSEFHSLGEATYGACVLVDTTHNLLSLGFLRLCLCLFFCLPILLRNYECSGLNSLHSSSLLLAFGFCHSLIHTIFSLNSILYSHSTQGPGILWLGVRLDSSPPKTTITTCSLTSIGWLRFIFCLQVIVYWPVNENRNLCDWRWNVQSFVSNWLFYLCWILWTQKLQSFWTDTLLTIVNVHWDMWLKVFSICRIVVHHKQSELEVDSYSLKAKVASILHVRWDSSTMRSEKVLCLEQLIIYLIDYTLVILWLSI